MPWRQKRIRTNDRLQRCGERISFARNKNSGRRDHAGHIEEIGKNTEECHGERNFRTGRAGIKQDLAIDSLSMVEVVLEAEIEFGVKFDQTELSEENLETTSAFIRLLESKR